ncbi:MAG: ribosome recycling factor [Parcubacteria group bacterium]
MTVEQLLKEKKSDFAGILDFYKQDISSIRTSRATPSLVEDIKVTIYEQQMTIKELASLSVPEPRVLIIQPWDKNSIEAINGAISKSDIGINPVVDGGVIRLVIPALTEERRRDFIKVLKQRTEEARIKVRRVREDIWNEIQKLERGGEIREDDKFAGKDDLQKVVDEYNKNIEGLEKKKEEEILNV